MAAECLAHLGLADGATEIVSPAVVSGREDGLVAVDCTLGFGGHSGLMLKVLAERVESGKTQQALLAAFDQDGVELAKTEARLREHSGIDGDRLRLVCIDSNFATIGSAFAQRQLPSAHALLADLGCSSMQIDDPVRGFTWKADGPLDMRMDTTSEGAALTAAEYLALSNASSFAAVLRANSDFEHDDSERIASAVLAEPRPTTTSQLDARARSVRPPMPAEATRGKGSGGGRGGGSGGGKGGSRSGGKGGKGDLARERDGGFKALEHARRLRAMGTKKLLQELEEDDETDVPSQGRGGRGSGAGAVTDAKALEKELNSRVARVMQALRIEVNDEFAALDALLASLPSVLAPNGRAVFLTFHSGEDRRVKQAMKAGLKAGTFSEISRRVVRVGREEGRANPRSKCCKLRWCVRAATSS